MGYVNLVGQACATPEECFQRMRDFLCKRAGTYDYSTTGIGWTLHDSSYAVDEDNLTDGDYIVVYSPGESGDEDIYIKFSYETTTYWMTVIGYLYWNNSTHAGVTAFNATVYGLMTRGTDHSIWIYGDLDAFNLVQNYNTTLYECAYFGRTTGLLYDDTVATCSSALTAGSDVSIALDAVPSTWKVGQSFFVRDNAGIEKATIKTIVSNTITADLTNSYAAGSKSATDLCYTIPRAVAVGSSYGLINHDGDAGGTYTTLSGNTILTSIITNNVPDTMNDAYLCEPIALYDTSPDGYYGVLKNIFKTASSGKTTLDILTSNDGTEYRFFVVGSYFFLFKEV